MKKQSKNEGIKQASDLLRGTLQAGLSEEITGSFTEADTQLSKFHGFYQQDDRDLRPERLKKKLEPAYAMMIRLRIPGGVCTPEQWLKLDRIATDYASGSLRITTRQTFQFHGVIKTNLKRTMQAIDASLLDTIAACGDVNRNVQVTANPHLSSAHGEAYELAKAISEHLLPRTRAWREIWLDAEKIVGGEAEDEPVYGRTYLPRKFKVAVVVPPDNDVDVYAQDLGFVALLDGKGAITGWNVTVGGGMGMTHGEAETYPCTAEVMGSCTTEQVLALAEAIVTVQRDWGDRLNRKHARLKYTVRDKGLDAFRAEVERRAGFTLGEAAPMTFDSTGDRLGWVKGENGTWHYTPFVENGRIKGRMREGLAAIAAVHQGEFRLTSNQNLIIAGVPSKGRKAIDALLAEYGLTQPDSGLRRNAMACVALPTCGLALAESERYLPSLVTELETVLDETGLRDDDIVIRMTGCPNGCARPYLAEIGLVGRNPGKYNLYLGAAFDGSRLNKLYRQDVEDKEIVNVLRPLLASYAAERETGERFGDFMIRTGVVAATRNGPDFHAGTPVAR